MKKILLAVIFMVLAVSFLEAAQTGVEVRARGKPVIRTKPNRTVTAVFQVTNRMARKVEFTTAVRFPKGWKLLTRDFRFTLRPNESDIRLFSFFVPQTAIARKYNVIWTVKGRRYPSITDSYTLPVVVSPTTRVEVGLLRAPEYVLAGKDYQVLFLVINKSNSTNIIDTRITSEPELPLRTDIEKVTLAPGESKMVIVSVKTDPGIRSLVRHHLRLVARVTREEQVEAYAESFVQIIPRITGDEGRFHTIPAGITLRYIGQQNARNTSGFQTEASWDGTLDEEGEKHIKVLLRGPNTQNRSVLGERDEYRLSFQTEHYELYLGDHTYYLSLLTENRYGRGVRAKVNLAPLSLEGYYQKSQWTGPEDRTIAARVVVSPNDQSKIGLGYLRREKELARHDFVSLQGQLSPFENTNAELEYAFAVKNIDTDREEDNAYAVRLKSYQAWMSFWLKFIHAGPSHPGYYKDVDFLSASVSAPIVKDLRAYAGIQRGKHNLDQDTTLFAAPLDQYYQIGLRYRFRTGTHFFLEYSNRSHEDLLAGSKFDYDENTYRLGAGQGFKKFSLNSSIEIGQSTDNLTGQSSDLGRYTVSSSFRPATNQSFSVYVRYTDICHPQWEKRRYISTGLKSSIQLATVTSFSLDVHTDNFQEPYRRGRDRFGIELSHVLPNNNKVSVRGIHTRDRNSDKIDDTALLVEYKVPFGLPVSVKKSIGRVKGHVYDHETKKPLLDVILRLNGATAVTDGKGNFDFPCLKPGTYHLDINAAGIGLDRIVIRKTPIEITVKPGKETFIQIGMTRRASLLGRIMQYGPENNHNNHSLGQGNGNGNGNGDYLVVGEGNGNHISQTNGDTRLVKVNGLANIQVELMNGVETLRWLTDNKGYFRFEDLRPGKWTLRVANENLPTYHYLEKRSIELEFGPGDKQKILVRVLPKKRRIRIIEHGGIISAK
ncbi:hypothetical protein E3J62_07370 [candidate division TA06 bacterium]|uniref:Carboxypeptidase regulatory-like domain-containing protein n=1 Tax=candidate division TA06 bacterium TaxID=2250710 RepID=A0A523UTG3_UNCT6|nr:MAG: hypothetical protein E3J62_07370 [candidate division TA06 bacterium]